MTEDNKPEGVMQEAAIYGILGERRTQDDMWGEQTHDPAYWLAILGKQVGQLGTEILNYKWASEKDENPMIQEATQVGAVAVAFIEACLAGRLSDEVTSAKPEPRKLAKVLDRGHEAVDYAKDEDIEVDTCYHCELEIVWDTQGRRWVHRWPDAYQVWLGLNPSNTEHAARFEPLCTACKRDNANGTHDALERTGHLSHAFSSPHRAGLVEHELGGEG